MASYATTIFSGALLLFLVQPLIGKYILPWFGGVPAVWTTCLLFFQTLLLIGYAYAHLATRLLSLRGQAALHLGLLAIAAVSLPITPSEAWKPAAGDDPIPWILALLTSSVAPSYLALSATGPLLQRWYSSQQADAPPYRFYALSNLGSLLALLAYPFLVEPMMSRHAQARLWSGAMLAFVLLCGLCAVRILRASTRAAAPPVEIAPREVSRPPLRDYGLWLAFPTVASLMLLAVTNKLCEELATVPLLWVFPLAVYLLSFILCFTSARWYRRAFFIVALLLWMGGYTMLASDPIPVGFSIAVYGSLLFIVCMVCHGELYRLRPHPRHLTAYYLSIASGGALGASLVALVAPFVFVYYEELQLGILATSALALVVLYADAESPLHRGRPRFAWLCLVASFAGLGYETLESAYEGPAFTYSSRSFHGGLYIQSEVDQTTGLPFEVLWSGNTQHGLQVRRGPLRRAPTTYFAEETGVGRALRSLELRDGLNVGVVGLGAGTLAAYGRRGDRIRFYEIDPRVVALARERFTYLSDSPAETEIALGDARLSLERESAQAFDMLVLDAFTSDAIPVHLLTREAFDTYLRHLRPDGLIAVHISNRHLDLRPVLVALGMRFGLETVSIHNTQGTKKGWVFPSTWVLLARDPHTLEGPLIASVATQLSDVQPILWTDERTSLLSVLGK